ncbi:UNVERIFIED_CONTAM: hypothetical protein RMT77_018952 [Armadillidium vulgare]
MQSPRTTRIINTMHHETLGTQVNNGYSESQSKVKANDRVSGYYIPLEILGKTRAHSEICFVDLGSYITILKRHRYEQLKGDCNFKVTNAHVSLRSITNGKISVYGKVSIEVKIHKYIHRFNALIVGDDCAFKGNILLGCDSLSTLPLVLDFEHNRMYYAKPKSRVPTINPFAQEVELKLTYKPSMERDLLEEKDSLYVSHNEEQKPLERREIPPGFEHVEFPKAGNSIYYEYVDTYEFLKDRDSPLELRREQWKARIHEQMMSLSLTSTSQSRIPTSDESARIAKCRSMSRSNPELLGTSELESKQRKAQGRSLSLVSHVPESISLVRGKA